MATLFVALLMTACDSRPKVIESESASEESGPVFPQADKAQSPGTKEMHEVVSEEVLNTDKYTYILVKEDEESFWIAIPKRDVEVGKTYYYSGGLLKKNFFSQEYNRVFETLYLVSGITEHPGLSGAASAAEIMSNMQGGGATAEEGPIDIKPAPGAITISELMTNRQKYAGKLVKVTGKCVKINPNIMDRNWIHLKDGSGDNVELTITTDEVIQLQSVVTMEGTISLNKDFGAGYRYEVIMEGAKAQ